MPQQDCAFCSLLAEPSESWLLDGSVAVAFLDRSPVFHGHTLVIPRDHHRTLADLPGELLSRFFADVQLVSRAVQQATESDGTFVAMNNIVSQSVPHFHVHVVPRRRGDGLRGFFWPRRRYADDHERTEIQTRIRDAITALQHHG